VHEAALIFRHLKINNYWRGSTVHEFSKASETFALP